MPAFICGLLFAGIISATMSSSDADLLGAGSVFANDIYKQFIGMKEDRQKSDSVRKYWLILRIHSGYDHLRMSLFGKYAHKLQLKIVLVRFS